MKFRDTAIFLLLSLLISASLYHDALFGKTLLAPLDIGPTLFEQYKFMNPAAGQVPQNHHIIDQFTYDLPLQKVIYDSYHMGEIPWWDPYTYGGRPLLADAHVNGTDPIRLLCYATMPFEMAYNWNYLLRGLLTGLGMFLLLRHFNTPLFAATILSLTYQFAGWFTLFWGHPWVQGSFVYFPFLWLVWMSGIRGGFWIHTAVGGVLCGLVFWAGNLQSHTYLPVFALCFLVGVFIADRRNLVRGMVLVAMGGLLGAMLAAPILANQLEFYQEGTRASVAAPFKWTQLLALPGALLSLHPWPGGSFKTFNATKAIGGGGGFGLFCGGAAGILALFSWRMRAGLDESSERMAKTSAVVCVVAYFVVVCTPLSGVLYSRILPLAGMGLIFLAAMACKALAARNVVIATRLPKVILITTFVVILAINAAIIIGFPRLEAKVRDRAGAAATAESLGTTTGLRFAQVACFVRESTLQNTEAAVGYVALLLMLGGFASQDGRQVSLAWKSALVLGLVSTLLFHQRFHPHHDVAMWNRLKQGGPSQLAAVARAGNWARVDESSLLMYQAVFPNAFPAFYKIHAVHGYSALQPRSLFRYPSDLAMVPADWRADFVGQAGGNFSATEGCAPARLRSATDGSAQPFEIMAESHNRLEVKMSRPLPVGSIVRTDTAYAGWGLGSSAAVGDPYGYCFTRWGVDTNHLVWQYRPRFLTPACILMLSAVLVSIVMICLGFRDRRMVSSANTSLVPG